MKIASEIFRLNADGVDYFTKYLAGCDISRKIDKTVMKRIIYSLEPVLLDYMDHGSDYSDFTLKITKRFGKTNFVLKIAGPSYNPLLNGEDDAFEKMRKSVGLTPSYSYADGYNVFIISIIQKLKLSFACWLIAAIVAGILLGVAGVLLPPAFVRYADVILTPISDAIFGLIKMTSIPVIFLCTVNGVLSCGNISDFGKRGKKIIGEYMLIMLILLLASVFAFLVMPEIKISSGGSSGLGLESLIDTLFSVFPDNLFAPFMNGDNIQIIIIAVIFGVALLVMGERAETVIEFTDQLRELCFMIMQSICTLMPVMFFILIARNIWNKEDIVAAAGAWKACVVIFVLYILAIIYDVIAVARRKGLSIKYIVQSVAPVCFKAFITASSMFVYSEMLDTLKNKLKTDRGHADFSLPLGIAFFEPNLIILSAFSMYFAVASGLEITYSWLFMLLLISFLYSVSAPPVSGGYVAIIAAVFEGLGINPLYFGIASSLVMLIDYPNTACRVALMMLEIAKTDEKKEVSE